GAAGKRAALPNARVMIHQPSGGMQGQSSAMEISVRQILELRKELYEILAHHSGKSIEQIEKDSDRDFWMRAELAKEYGLIAEELRRKKEIMAQCAFSFCGRNKKDVALLVSGIAAHIGNFCSDQAHQILAEEVK